MSFSSKLNHAGARRLLAAAVLAGGVALAGSGAQATTIHDDSGDLLGTYGGPHTGDFDVTEARVTYDSTNVRLFGQMDADIGTSPNGVYVWGVNRGQGTPFLFHPDEEHPIGEHVLFDAAIILSLNADLPSFILYLDANGHPEGTQALDHSYFTIEGAKINALIPRQFLPSKGAEFGDYGYNLWPRFAAVGGTRDVADFAPNDSTFTGSAVPEPATWGLMIMGFGLAGSALRRRRVVAA